MRRALVWMRDDLRLDDHLALSAALERAPEGTVLLYVFDPRVAAEAPGIGASRLGPHRARFLAESVSALRDAARLRGGELVVRRGDPIELVPALARQLDATQIFLQAHVAHEECTQEARLERGLAEEGRSLVRCPGRTLIAPEDLPFAIDDLPDVFTAFRKKVEARCDIEPPLDAPRRLPALPHSIDAGEIPAVEPTPARSDALLAFRGGEAAARARLEGWMFEADALQSYKQTRNGLLHADDSSKLSPWLAAGCLSPRRVYAEKARYEAERVANPSTYWLGFELLWRDYFAFLALREGARLFALTGVGRRRRRCTQDRGRFEAWREGQTGYPFVDAFMRELASTGFMSNRGRQNVASFLAKTLEVDWRWGAAWFERCLVDYDAASNYGSWQYVAGVGTDPRDRVFDVVRQARMYDPDGAFVRRWVPELASLDGGAIHEPWRSAEVFNYPAPIVSPRTPKPRLDR